MSKKSYKIAFVHPDLGIGGAERLVVDAAVGLQDLDNDIIIYTSHCDLTHCFEEVSSGQLKYPFMEISYQLMYLRNFIFYLPY